MIEVWENVSEADQCINTGRPLTRSLDLGEEGLAMQATRICSVTGCDRPVHARTWCNAHHMRWLRHGDPTGSKPRRTTPPCTIEGCNQPNLAHGLCQMHHGRWRRGGDPSRARSSAVGLPGDQNIRWLGDQANYIGVHTRLRLARGRAKEYPCADCGLPAAEWSYDHGDPDERVHGGLVYSLNPERYQPRCKSCHWAIDNPAGFTPPPGWRNAP